MDERDNVFSFSWNGTTELSYRKRKKKNLYVFTGCTHPKKNTLNSVLKKSEVTNQTILVIRDFADKGEVKDQSQLWGYQVKDRSTAWVINVGLPGRGRDADQSTLPAHTAIVEK